MNAKGQALAGLAFLSLLRGARIRGHVQLGSPLTPATEGEEHQAQDECQNRKPLSRHKTHFFESE